MVDPEVLPVSTRVGPARPLEFRFTLSRRVAGTILHASIVAIVFFQLIFACLYWYHHILSAAHYYGEWEGPSFVKHVALPIQIIAYPAIACLYISTSSSPEELVFSGAFLCVLALIVIFTSINAGALHMSIMFVANIVSVSAYCMWKLYPVAVAHAQRIKWLPLAPAWQQEKSGGLLRLPKHTTFRIQDLPREFSCGEILAMTQDFQSMVGQGGSAQVFRGILDDATAVAVKRITITTSDQSMVGEAEFLKEISIVANVHHRSLVRLLGYCRLRGGDRYLVYPFFQNGSLDRWLFHGEERRRLLPWPTRRCIAIDVARALAYLHHECRLQILHLDIKPGNILLDGDLRAHVSDFGISMSITPDLSSVDTRGRGTFGYMAPEMMVNAVSAKSDVYSYGMMLLELVGGRRNFEPSSSTDASSATLDLSQDFYPFIVREKMVRGDLLTVVDEAMSLVDEGEVEVVVKVALCCIQRRWDTRPSMPTVVDMLEGRVAAELPPETCPSSALNFSESPASSSTQRSSLLSNCQTDMV